MNEVRRFTKIAITEYDSEWKSYIVEHASWLFKSFFLLRITSLICLLVMSYIVLEHLPYIISVVAMRVHELPRGKRFWRTPRCSCYTKRALTQPYP